MVGLIFASFVYTSTYRRLPRSSCVQALCQCSGHFFHGNAEAPAHPGLMPMYSLSGKTAIVTGAGADIGLAVANGLAEAGANVALSYQTNTNASERAQEIAAKYGAYQVNITNAQAAKQATEQSVKDFKGPVVDVPLGHYSDVVNIDLNGTYYCAKYAAYYWRKQKEEGIDLIGNPLGKFTYGGFVATASMSGHIINYPQLQAAYNAAKTSVIHLYSHGCEGSAEDLKDAYLYLASGASSSTTGFDIVVDGGYCAP
ncbi:putative carbonyl reductase [Aspergillus undulatus]|uniref:putative carbonyl reductase n=1 Tax=Aspergillus undulatus TaxID=1810928 RepID=UPI003CCE3E3E